MVAHFDMPSSMRVRLVYVALALVTIALGLVTHLHATSLTPVARDVVGDALWAAMIAWWMGAVWPSASLKLRGALALATCFAVEVSQLYHTSTLDAIRGTMVGHLVLGSGFDARDLLAYAAGVAIALMLEAATIRFRPTHSRP